jgi:crotonobetainyl-CoA:carnitine CoA-transferase CaiB-like acyl-CoA transferase
MTGRGPCSGIRVLEFCTMVSGPMCGQILGDFGADVLKLEGLAADPMRSVQPRFRDFSALYSQFNRNKRSIVVDVKSAAGRDVIHSIASNVDIFLENCRPGVAERLGLGYERLSADNAGLIYVSVNGFGEDGPYRDYPAYDPMIQGLTGFMPVQGELGAPAPIRSLVVDKVAALSAALSSLAALQARHATGVGQKVEVKMLDAFAAFMLPERMNNHTFQSPDAGGLPVVDTSRVTCAIATLDGHVTGLVFQDTQFQGMCTALGREDIRSDPRFASPSARITHIGELSDALGESLRSLTTAEFLELARAHDIPFAQVNDINGFFADPQVRHNRTYFDADDPEFGALRQLNAFASFAHTPPGGWRRAPKYGEHTREVLLEFGYEPDAVEQLAGDGVIRSLDGVLAAP